MGISGSSFLSASTSSAKPRPIPYVPEMTPYRRIVRRSYRVELYVYDLANGWASFLSRIFTRFHIEAVWHTSIVVYGTEYSYGIAGIQVDNPGKPKRKIFLGYTTLSKRDLYEILVDLQENEFHHCKYNPFATNCHVFSELLSQILCDVRIPREYSTLGERMRRLISLYYPEYIPRALASASGSTSARYLSP